MYVMIAILLFCHCKDNEKKAVFFGIFFTITRGVSNTATFNFF